MPLKSATTRTTRANPATGCNNVTCPVAGEITIRQPHPGLDHPDAPKVFYKESTDVSRKAKCVRIAATGEDGRVCFLGLGRQLIQERWQNIFRQMTDKLGDCSETCSTARTARNNDTSTALRGRRRKSCGHGAIRSALEALGARWGAGCDSERRVQVACEWCRAKRFRITTSNPNTPSPVSVSGTVPGSGVARVTTTGVKLA
jgi:hypothetical protein